MPDAGNDPPLSACGEARARALAVTLADAGVRTIYVTSYQRTQLTARPLAERLHLTPIQAATEGTLADQAKALASDIRAHHAGEVVLVVGHSNTVPAIVRALGGTAPEVLDDSEYATLFTVTLGSSGSASTIRASYGVADGACVAPAPLPSTDIYLAPLENRSGRLRIATPVNITARTGYDNQPSFSPDGKTIVYTSIREDGQADTYRYELAGRITTRLTTSPESEYSPTFEPGGGAIATVLVEPDSTQRLWEMDPDGTHPRLVIPGLKPVGYQAWLDDHTVALFVLGNPPRLEVADRRAGTSVPASSDIGRSLQRIPGTRHVSFLAHTPQDEWWITAWDGATRTSSRLVRALAGSQDVAWTPDGHMLMAQDGMVFSWRKGGTWQQVADLADAGLRHITRMAVSPGGEWVALVADDRPAPTR
jgi:phosphohistidine phosphatase SixA